MLISDFVRENIEDVEEVKSLNAFLQYFVWDEKEVGPKRKISHKDLMSKVSIYARTLFEDRELFIKSMNFFIEVLHGKKLLIVEKDITRRKLFCQIDKIYDSTEMKIKLLKYLQGKGDGKPRHVITKHFNLENRKSLDKRILELKSSDNHILGTKIQINLERKTNQYYSTVHPLFLALNLSEVYGMLACLIKSEKDVPGGTVTDIIKDIVPQLTDYAKDVLKESGLDIDAYYNDEPHTFREESPKHKYYHAMKTGSDCCICLYDDEQSMVGKIKLNFNQGKEFVFHPKDGSSPFELDCDEIKDLIEIEEA